MADPIAKLELQCDWEKDVAKLPTKTKGLKGIPIGTYDQVRDASGKTVIKPKVSRKTSVSQKIAQRKSKRITVKRRGA